MSQVTFQLYLDKKAAPVGQLNVSYTIGSTGTTLYNYEKYAYVGGYPNTCFIATLNALSTTLTSISPTISTGPPYKYLASCYESGVPFAFNGTSILGTMALKSTARCPDAPAFNKTNARYEVYLANDSTRKLVSTHYTTLSTTQNTYTTNKQVSATISGRAHFEIEVYGTSVNIME